MSFDILSFYEDFGIDYIEHGHKHCRPGWIQTPCPFCTGNPGYHLGFNLNTNFFSCWRCGFHSNIEVIHEFAATDWGKAKTVLKEYQSVFNNFSKQTIEKKRRVTELIMPPLTGSLGKNHKKYLINRGYNPDTLANEWDLLGTGPVGSYKNRIIAPITYNGKMVSYQGRDITGRSGLRYKACEQANEIIDHHNLLYGLDNVKGNKCILVEGITDAWRLGYGAVATLGIKFKPIQFQLLWERFNTVYIMFDDDPQAQAQAQKIGNDLVIMFDIDVEICQIKGDPGSLKQEEANEHKKELLGE